MPLRKAVAFNLRLILAWALLCTVACTQRSTAPLRTITNSVGMKFVWIDPGSFRMGSDDKEPDEKPAHMVTLSKGFYLQTTEVTQRQWEAVMGTNPSHFKGPDRPVEMVSWRDAQEFLKKLNAKEKDSRYRLPSEAEWECACRAGGQEPDEAANLDEVAWRGRVGGLEPDEAAKLGEVAWRGENSSGETHPVGQKKPNAWGLFDMRGNVWEWVQDSYGAYSVGRQIDPRGPDSSGFRVLRGGGWRGLFTGAYRCARRDFIFGSSLRDGDFLDCGFRCARTF